MKVLKSSAHVRTMRHARSFRSVRTSTGVSMAHLDRARLRREEEWLARREERRSSPSGVHRSSAGIVRKDAGS